ncbi:MAG: UDP-N-acetylmuramate--alanine ligase [Myxococcota bacterium]
MKDSIHHMHFVGIAGVGMSGLAELMHSRAFKVTGSDLAGGRVVDHLIRRGIDVSIGHDKAHVEGADVVIYSTAIPNSNPELAYARERNIPIVHRGDMLAEAMRGKQGIAISGTHGKTTTTAMVSHVLTSAGLDPTALVGGWVERGPNEGGGSLVGAGDWLITEADESDGSFLKLAPCVAVITNIDADHLEHYGDMAALEEAFMRFAACVPFWGFAVMCTDDPRTKALADKLDVRVLRYGVDSDADWVARDVAASATGMSFHVDRHGEHLGEIELPTPGLHNVANCMAAIATAIELKVPFETVASALATFGGVARRFEAKGSAGGVQVVDDYGHHPVEVRATLAAARAGHDGRLVVVFQPHRYTRTRDCLDDFTRAFGDCDLLVIADTYAAGEAPIAGAEASTLADGVRETGHPDVRFIASLDTIGETLPTLLREGDLVLTLGAGDITRLGPLLLQRIGQGEAS